MGTVCQVPWTRIGADKSEWPEKGLKLLNDMGFKTAAMALAVSTEKLAGRGMISVWLDFGENWAEHNQAARYQMVQSFDVFEPITEGEALLTGFEKMTEAEELADLITENLLPFDLKVESIRFD